MGASRRVPSILDASNLIYALHRCGSGLSSARSASSLSFWQFEETLLSRKTRLVGPSAGESAHLILIRWGMVRSTTGCSLGLLGRLWRGMSEEYFTSIYAYLTQVPRRLYYSYHAACYYWRTGNLRFPRPSIRNHNRSSYFLSPRSVFLFSIHPPQVFSSLIPQI